MSGQLDDHALVDLIESFPILYDKDSARGMQNASRKDAAWKTVSLKLGASERACITRWKSIRDRFGKEFRRFQEHPNEPTYWDMFPRLLFLKDHYKHGLVKHESLDGMKFLPKERRRRVRSRFGESEKKLEEEEEQDQESIELNQRLIELVKIHPVLYHRKQIRDSNNLSAKNDAWRLISESLEVSEELCYNRWKKLRDRFAREYRNHQINQSQPVTWRYYNNLQFLAHHYRKGVPLIIENLKRPGRPSKGQSEITEISPSSMYMGASPQVWGADYPYSSDNEELEENEERYDDPDDEIAVISDAGQQLEQQVQQEQQTFIVEEEPTLMVEQQQQPQQLHLSTNTTPSLEETQLHSESFAVGGEEVLIDPSTTVSNSGDDPTPAPEKLIGNVISNIETVLRQSKDCLQALHAQNQRHQLELEATTTAAQMGTSANQMLSKAQMLLDSLSPEQRRNAERKIVHFLCECQIKTLDGDEIEDVAPCQIYNC
ncbi:uncharacterized protein LOC115631523 isoform X2 [Scaptodrosophila lebanonensis]|uniref:Uncharacterized protein LOC115631523 isoform X2 n=1 Tax=Drosophila lebanonensis TaxID=7225 RepID=A0A6J2U842_DROLE|nr:uncharacterized protein LOC115631523 isoform X2 [Scaptodrosophila lebanonensis]